MSWLVYLISFPNGKHYVGVTSREITYRKAQHKYDAFNNGPAYHNPLYRAVRKYSWENITFTILEKDLSDNFVDAKEINYIEKYASLKTQNGYNIQMGGVERKLVSEETKKKMSKWRKENWVPCIEVVEKMQVTKSKPIACYDLDGNLIKEYLNANEAERIDNFCSNSINRCVNNKQKTHNKLIWKYINKDEFLKTYSCKYPIKENLSKPQNKRHRQLSKESIEKMRITRSKPIGCYDLKNNLLKTYLNPYEAANLTGYSARCIYTCLSGKTKTYKDLIWKHIIKGGVVLSQ